MTLVIFKYLRVILTNPFLQKFVIVFYLVLFSGRSVYFQRLPMGLPHYNNSHHIGRGINVRILPNTKYICSRYIQRLGT